MKIRNDEKNSVSKNLISFWNTVAKSGNSKSELLAEAEYWMNSIGEEKYAEIRKMAEESRVSFLELLAFNLFHETFQPEGCTVFFAAGKASASGSTIIAKNSDKGGDQNLTGEGCVNYHEINVVSWFDNEDGSHVIGVSAAGNTGIKMGMNSHGVAATTNYGYSAAAQKRTLSVKDKFAGDRAQIARDGLQKKTALEAAQYVAARLMDTPMATSGMITYADAKEVYVIENVYEHVAISKVTDAIDTRSNYLQTLSLMNEPGNASCFCRYHRSQTLMKQIEGKATVEDLKRISMDHHDGTGAVGICRHTEGILSSTQASAVMECNAEHPEQSVIHIALGKPCNAWRRSDGNISIRLDMKKEEIAKEFLRGDAYVKYGFAEPVEE